MSTALWYRDWFPKLIDRLIRSFSRLPKLQTYLLVGLIASGYLFIYFLYRSDNIAILRSENSASKATQPLITHPILSLVTTARDEFSALSARQSSSLDQAIAEYKRRYAVDPPPYFDKWYAFVTENNVPLVDEYDIIHDTLQPFWGFSPAGIRDSVRNAINADDFLIGLFIRNGIVKSTDRGPTWKENAIKGAIEPFAHLLPDMDLAFNMHDEPRVIIPHDQLSQMLKRSERAQKAHRTKRGSWSAPPDDLNDGFSEPSSITPFLEYAHKFTWPVATLSCPPDSPARMSHYDSTDSQDESSAYLSTTLGFIHNRTASTDICLSPSLQHLHGFFNKPNAWSITHDPIPIFSPSKVSSFHDVLFPAPWYLGDQVTYDEEHDPPWDEKRDVLYWRGSTTSGYSAGGTWRLQERQRFVESVEKPGPGLIMRKGDNRRWQPAEVAREEYQDMFDVHFSFVGQCSEEDCAEQEEYFDVRPNEPYTENWQNKFLLDIDGNAFSGRFYTFLESRSLTLKQALFREWHEDRITPWVHYIPLGLNGSDHFEIMRFLTEDVDGMRLAKEIADESSQQAKQSLRHVDMQAWMFRLLLEYARLVDNGRDEIGFRLS